MAVRGVRSSWEASCAKRRCSSSAVLSRWEEVWMALQHLVHRTPARSRTSSGPRSDEAHAEVLALGHVLRGALHRVEGTQAPACRQQRDHHRDRRGDAARPAIAGRPRPADRALGLTDRCRHEDHPLQATAADLGARSRASRVSLMSRVRTEVVRGLGDAGLRWSRARRSGFRSWPSGGTQSRVFRSA